NSKVKRKKSWQRLRPPNGSTQRLKTISITGSQLTPRRRRRFWKPLLKKQKSASAVEVIRKWPVNRPHVNCACLVNSPTVPATTPKTQNCFWLREILLAAQQNKDATVKRRRSFRFAEKS